MLSWEERLFGYWDIRLFVKSVAKLFGKKEKESLDEGLQKTKEGFLSKITKAIAGKSTVDEEVLDNLEDALLLIPRLILLGLAAINEIVALNLGADFDILVTELRALENPQSTQPPFTSNKQWS